MLQKMSRAQGLRDFEAACRDPGAGHLERALPLLLSGRGGSKGYQRELEGLRRWARALQGVGPEGQALISVLLVAGPDGLRSKEIQREALELETPVADVGPGLRELRSVGMAKRGPGGVWSWALSPPPRLAPLYPGRPPWHGLERLTDPVE